MSAKESATTESRTDEKSAANGASEARATTGTAAERWVDVRMTEPGAGEWDVDVVVLDGRVQAVDLRVRPSLLASFVGCLVADVSDERAAEVLATVAARQGIDADELVGAEPGVADESETADGSDRRESDDDSTEASDGTTANEG